MASVQDLNDKALAEAFWGNLGDLGVPAGDIPQTGAILVSNPKKPTLKVGDSGADVAKMHVMLVKAQAKIGDDSQTAMDVVQQSFGGATLSAVKAVQQASGLSQSGLVDDATWRALGKLSGATSAATQDALTKAMNWANQAASSFSSGAGAAGGGVATDTSTSKKLPGWVLPVGAITVFSLGIAGIWYFSKKKD
jgi:peptidoglycan hydrolase-like protein with peptidoglycan-binding domain